MGFYETLDALYAQGPDRVEDFLARQLSAAESADRRIQVLNEQGSFYRAMGRYAPSETAFRAAMDLLEETGRGDSRQYTVLLLNLAGTYRLAGRPEEAAEHFGRVLTRVEPGDYLYTTALNNLALTRKEQGRLEEAEELLTRALDQLLQQPPAGDEVPVTLSNLAAVHLQQGQVDRADARAREALDRYRLPGAPQDHYPSALATWGWVLLRQDRAREAAQAFREAMDLLERRCGQNEEYRSAAAGLQQALRLAGEGEP